MSSSDDGRNEFQTRIPLVTMDRALRFTSDIPRQAYEYWVSKCGGRTMPDRHDIVPTEIARFISSVALIELRRGDDGRLDLFVRLAGRDFEDVFGRLHGRRLADALAPSVVIRWRMMAETMLEILAPIRLVGQVTHEDKGFIRYEAVHAPLANGDEEMPMIFAVAAFTTTGPAPSS